MVSPGGSRSRDWSNNQQKSACQTYKRVSSPAGLHLLECSGNVREAHFGMLSVADWAGAPVSEILDSVTRSESRQSCVDLRLRSLPGHFILILSRVRVGYSRVDELKSSKAFFATTMNGSSLPKDHGCPSSPRCAGLVWMHMHQVGRSKSNYWARMLLRLLRCASSPAEPCSRACPNACEITVPA